MVPYPAEADHEVRASEPSLRLQEGLHAHAPAQSMQTEATKATTVMHKQPTMCNPSAHSAIDILLIS